MRSGFQLLHHSIEKSAAVGIGMIPVGVSTQNRLKAAHGGR
jgi:hypothetical protein